MPDGSGKITEPKVKEVIAQGVQIVVGVANDRQMTFTTMFADDEADEVVSARFDRIFALADRQKARYEVEELEAELLKTRETLSQFQEDLARVEAQHEVDQANRQIELATRKAERGTERERFMGEIDASILRMNEARQTRFNHGAEAYAATGREGAYSPRGRDKNDLARIDKAISDAKENREKALEDFDQTYDAKIEALEAEIAGASATREQAIGNLNISIRRYVDAVVSQEARLEKCRQRMEG